MRAVVTALFALTLMPWLMAGLMPASIAHAEDGMFMEETDRWRVYRNPKGRYERKYTHTTPKEAPEAGSSTPILILEPRTQARAPAIEERPTRADREKNRIAIGAFYSPLAETVVPVLSLRVAGSLHIAAGATKKNDMEVAEVMLYSQNDIVPDRWGVFAGLSYIYVKDKVTPGCAEIKAAGDGGSAFGGITLTIKKRLQLLAGISSGRINTDGSANGCGYEESFYDDWQRVSGTLGLVYYIW